MPNERPGKTGFLLFTLVCFVGIGVCLIVDFAVSKALTWAWYPLLGAPFAWIVLSPAIAARKHKIVFSMLAFTVAVLPFLYALAKLTPGGDWFPGLGLPIAAPFLAALWIMLLIARLARNVSRWFIAAIAAFLFGVLANGCAAYFISGYLGESVFTVQNAVNLLSGAVMTAVFIILGVIKKKKA